MRLEKWQRNPLIEAWEAAGLDPKDFDLTNDRDSDTEARIAYRGSESHFTLKEDAGVYSGTRVVGDSFPRPYEAYSWSAAEDYFSRWCSEVKRDIDTPDLWAELEREREMLGSGPTDAVENSPLSEDERAEIAKQLQEIKEFVKKTYALSESQTQELEAKLEYLNDAAQRLGRVDWRAVALGTLLPLAAEAILPPENARHVVLMFLGSLGHLFGYPLPGLPSGP